MLNIKERIEIILNKPIKQVGLLEVDRSNAVAIGYEYDEFGGIKDPDNQVILEWNLEDKQPTVEELEAIEGNVLNEYINSNNLKTKLYEKCKEYLTATEFKYTVRYMRENGENEKITATCSICSNFCSDYEDGVDYNIEDIISRLSSTLDYENKYSKIFEDIIKDI